LLSSLAAYSQVVDSLPRYEQESSIVTKEELQLSHDWFNNIIAGNPERASWIGEWISSAVPFSFQYDAVDSVNLLKKWRLEKGESRSGEGGITQDLSWTDPSTGLRTSWHIKRFTDYPAVEWVLTFENRGTKDTPILENIQALDLRLNHSGSGEYMVHGVNGGRSLPDDLTPYAIQLPAHDLWRKRTQLGGDFPSSNRHLPFFNLESPDGRGVLIGVGWSGNWLTRLEVNDSQLQVRTGLKATHFVLRPGEGVRSRNIPNGSEPARAAPTFAWNCRKRASGSSPVSIISQMTRVLAVIGRMAQPVSARSRPTARVSPKANTSQVSIRCGMRLRNATPAW
jgi:hypothetical protein